MVQEVELTAEGTPIEPMSPHEQLIAGFNALKVEKDALKKERDALMALTALQEKEKKALAEKVKELESKLELKAVSAEAQIAEVESFSGTALAEAIEKNAKYCEKISDLESSLAETKDDKEHMLQRTAVLARRDQLQKANIMALTREIDTLTDKIIEFEKQFSSLASRSAEMSTSQKYKIESREEPASLESLPEFKNLLEEKKVMTDRVIHLEALCEKLKKTENIMKDSFVETLTRHRESWMKEKNHLKKQVKELVSEKESIENQVKEIAELLERDIRERTIFSNNEHSEQSVREPPGMKKEGFKQ